MAPTRTFQPTITASRWESVHAATVLAANRKRGGGSDSSPPLSNGDAAALIEAWASASGTGAMPLWYQFAAAAYGWDPAKPSQLDTTPRRRDSIFDIGITPDLWSVMRQTARGLDQGDESPRLDIDADTFDSPVFQAGVKAAIKADAGMSTRSAKVAIGCKDKQTGKLKAPKMKCREGFELELVTGTPFYVCRNKKTGETEQPTYECDGETVYIETDPITAIGKALAGDLGKLALILGMAYLVFEGFKENK